MIEGDRAAGRARCSVRLGSTVMARSALLDQPPVPRQALMQAGCAGAAPSAIGRARGGRRGAAPTLLALLPSGASWSATRV
jgi:hypothetical protein